jgi:hypothetical protein
MVREAAFIMQPKPPTRPPEASGVRAGTDPPDGGRAQPEHAVEESSDSGDKFYRGTICKLQRNAQRGSIHAASGREIPFVFQYVTMLGPHRHFEDLVEGMEVGYDVSWTSRGLRVSVIRIPD